MARSRNTRHDGSPCSQTTVEALWQKGTPEPGHPSFRKAECGASMQREKYGKQSQWGRGIDHIKPVSKGGADDLSNLQPVQVKNSRHKADEWPNFECKVWSCSRKRAVSTMRVAQGRRPRCSGRRW